MKVKYTLFHRLLLFTVFICTHVQTAVAQSPDINGYWVVESNLITKDFTIVKFYDEHGLIYEEKLTGICLDITRRKNVKMLNYTLKMVQHNQLVAGQIKGYSDLIANIIYKKRYDN